MTEHIKSMSLNGRGLCDLAKRRDVLSYIRHTHCSLYCLQDTHFAKADEKIIRAQWGYECIFSYGSRGVCILINNHFDYQITTTELDNEGKW